MAGYPLMGPSAKHTMGALLMSGHGSGLVLTYSAPVGGAREPQGQPSWFLCWSDLARAAGACIADSRRRKQGFPPLEN